MLVGICLLLTVSWKVTVACLASLLFLGGWSGPLFGPGWLQQLLPLLWFALRIFGFLFVYFSTK